MATDLEKKLRRELDEARRRLAEAEARATDRDASHLAAVTALDAAQKKIELAHEEWINALDTVRDPIFLHDRDFRIMRCNRAYQRRAGIPFDRIIGQPYYDVFPKGAGPLPGCRHAAEGHVADEDSEVVVGDAVFRSRADPILDEAGGYLYSVHTLEDVTARRQAEEAIRSSRDLLRSVVENIPVRVFWKDRDLTYLGCNTLFAHDAGLSGPEDLLGKDDFEMGWRDQAELYRADDAEVMDSGKPKLGYEEPQTTPDGRTIWLRTSKVPLPGPDGKTIGMLGLYEDITERKEAEDAVRRSEAQARDSERKFHGIASAALDAIVMIDDQGRIIYWNPAATRIFGYQADEVFNRNLHDILAPARYREEHHAAFGAFAKSGTGPLVGKTVELEGWRKDGTEIPISLSVSALPIGGRWHAVGLVRDISDRKRAEAELRASESRFRDLVENSSDWIWEVDANGVYTYSSPRAKDLLGYSAEEIVGKTPFDLMAPEEAKRVGALFGAIAAERRAFAGLENTNLHKDGGEVVLETSGVPAFDDAGTFIGYRGVDRDITSRKRRDEALRRSEASLSEAQRIARLGSWELDLVSGRLILSDEIYRIFEVAPDTFTPSFEAFLASIHPDDRASVEHTYAEHVKSGVPYDIVHRLLFADGRIKYVQEVCDTVYDGDRPLRSLGTVQDITERRLAEVALAKLNRTLRTLSAGNGVLVRAGDETDLLKQMCATIVENAGYRLAWIGMVEHDAGKSVRPVANAGFEEGYLESLDITWADEERGQGPTGCAVRTGTYQLAQDILADPKFVPWREQARRRGYASSIAVPLKDTEGKVFGVLNIYAVEAQAFGEAEIKLLQELADDISYGIRARRVEKERVQYLAENLKNAGRLKEALVGTIGAIALTVEKRDPYTAGHQVRVADLATAIGAEIGLDADRIEGLKLGCLIHDIGKIYVPAEILNRPGALSEAEFGMIKSHCQVGYDIIKDVVFPWPVADMVLQHHERRDGSGYPNGLKGDEIILEARILTVADVVEAISAHRPYRPALGIDVALEEILGKRGVWYDEAVVDACVRLVREKGYVLPAMP